MLWCVPVLVQHIFQLFQSRYFPPYAEETYDSSDRTYKAFKAICHSNVAILEQHCIKSSPPILPFTWPASYKQTETSNFKVI